MNNIDKLFDPEKIVKNKNCRGCEGTRFTKWLNLGMQPLANCFLTKTELNLMELGSLYEDYFPLEVVYCNKCNLVQLSHIVNPNILFKDYLYYSSTSQSFREHFERLAEKEFNLDRVSKGDIVVDIGSNDGILLRPFKDLGAHIIGIEPAKEIAKRANKSGIATIPEYFTKKLAAKIVKDNGKATLITMTNVFAHVNDLKEILDGVKLLLAPEGKFMIEVPYLHQMLEDGTFDLIYHEHLSYFHIASLRALLRRFGLEPVEVERVPVHGGSLRVYSQVIKNDSNWQPTNDEGLITSRKFREFPKKIEHNKREVLRILDSLKKQNKRIVGFGAPAKMSTMLNYYGIGKNYFQFVIDDAYEKQGLYTPGTHLKVVKRPVDLNYYADYVFIFAWNFKDQIMMSLKAQGYKGKFIIPFPNPTVI